MSYPELFAIASAVMAILMIGSGRLRINLLFYAFQTVFASAVTASCGLVSGDHQLYSIGLAILLVKAIGVSAFIAWITKRIGVTSDPGTLIPVPLSMHASIVFLVVAHLLASQLPHLKGQDHSLGGATAAISLLLTGTLFMLARKVAVSQIIGFLTMENGIYLFALTQTRGMPMMVELGILLDVLVVVMIAGLIIFRIKRSFEHIDVTLLTELKEY